MVSWDKRVRAMVLTIAATSLAVLVTRTASSQATMALSTARELAKVGLADYDAGRFDDAAERLLKAFQVVRMPTLAVYGARALARTGRLLQAAELYLQAASLEPAPDWQPVQKEMQETAVRERGELLGRIPRLAIILKGAKPDEVSVTIDGVNVPNALLAGEQMVEPGTRRVLGRRGTEEVAVEVMVAERERRTATLEFPEKPDESSLPTAALEPTIAPLASPSPPTPPLPPPSAPIVSPDPQHGSVLVRFKLPTESDHWALVGPDGNLVCSLPCEQHVQPGNGLVLRSAVPGDDITIPVPSDLGLAPVVDVVPKRAPSKVVPILMLSIGGATTVALLASVASGKCENDPGDDCGSTAGGVGTVTGAVAIAGLIWLAASPGPRAKVEPVSVGDTGTRLHSGSVVVGLGRRVHMALTPAGLAGFF